MTPGDPKIARNRTVDYMGRRRCRKPVGMMVVVRLPAWQVRRHRCWNEVWRALEPWSPERY